MGPLDGFPPLPAGIKGRSTELRTLTHMIMTTRPTRVALVGSGGSGKSMLAAALGHRLRREFEGRVDWFRVGAWDFRTVTEMFALRFGTSRGERRVQQLRRFLSGGPRLIVLDNHEDDRAMARLLSTFASTDVTWLITARRCLLGGVLIFPVTAPSVTSGQSAFPRVSRLTRTLRWNPLALDIADAIVASRAASVGVLERFLEEHGVGRVQALEHEDDLPEIGSLLDWAWPRLSNGARRALAVLSHVDGDHVDTASLGRLAGLGRSVSAALEPLLRWRLVQEPLRGRYALHAVVRHVVARRTRFSAARSYEHYVSLIERDPARFALEQTHLFGAMDYAYRESDMNAILRVDALLCRIEAQAD
ncbi:MAG: ABC transporter ATP-binding protein [Polyangiaceae bacterium]